MTLTIVHNRCGDILAGDSLIPGGLYIQIKSHLAAILARIQQVPLKLEVGICGNVGGAAAAAVIAAQRRRSLLQRSRQRNCTQTTLDTHKARLLHSQVDLYLLRRKNKENFNASFVGGRAKDVNQAGKSNNNKTEIRAQQRSRPGLEQQQQ